MKNLVMLLFATNNFLILHKRVRISFCCVMHSLANKDLISLEISLFDLSLCYSRALFYNRFGHVCIHGFLR